MREYVGHTVWQQTRYIFFKKGCTNIGQNENNTWFKTFCTKATDFKICLLSFSIFYLKTAMGSVQNWDFRVREAVSSPRPSLNEFLYWSIEVHVCDFSLWLLRLHNIWLKYCKCCATSNLKYPRRAILGDNTILILIQVAFGIASSKTCIQGRGYNLYLRCYTWCDLETGTFTCYLWSRSS